MSSLSGDPPQRKSKQLASKSISEQSRRRLVFPSSEASSTSAFPSAVYGDALDADRTYFEPSNQDRNIITNGLLITVSEMYFGTTDPFAEILRCLDDRIDPHTRRYVSGLETLLKNEVLDPGNAKNKTNREKVIITPLDMLSCAFRRQEIIDGWTPYDVALFELALCRHRGYHPKKLLSELGGRKTLDEISGFFDNVYSKTKSWEKLQKIINNESMGDEDDNFEIKNEVEVEIAGLSIAQAGSMGDS
jgi:hypothetical protein